MKKPLLLTFLTYVVHFVHVASANANDNKMEFKNANNPVEEKTSVIPPFLVEQQPTESSNVVNLEARQLREFDFEDVEALESPEFIESSFAQEGLMENSEDDVTSEEIKENIAKARALLAKVKESEKYIEYLGPQSIFELPVAKRKIIGGLEYTIVFDSLRLTPTHAELDAYMIFEMPQNGKSLAFMAKGIKFTSEGGIVGDARLDLLGSYAIKMNGGKSRLIINGGNVPASGSPSSSPTFVKFDCDGFQEMGLSASIEFSRNFFLPEDENGKIIEGNVTGHFTTQLSDWNDLVAEISLPNFQVNGLTGYGVSINQAVFDFSDTRNVPGLLFPKDYPVDEAEIGQNGLWRGIYVREASIRLPQQFSKRGTERTSFAGYNMIIDSKGFSGLLTATHLVQLDEGKMDSWQFSLDSVGVNIVTGELQAASLGGKIVVPAFDESEPFAYSASYFGDEDYRFVIETTDTLAFPVWAADVSLYESSYLEVLVTDGKFRPHAYLNGQISVNAAISKDAPKSDENNVKLAQLDFEAMEIWSQAPYFSIGAFSFGAEGLASKTSGFPISLTDIYAEKREERVNLEVGVLISLSKDGFGGGTNFTVAGNLLTKNERLTYEFDRVYVNEVSIDIESGVFSLDGSLNFFNDDKVYGNGFSGNINAKLSIAAGDINMQASAAFGKIDGFRYWFADILVSTPFGIQITPGVALYGFGGGLYKGMAIAAKDPGSAKVRSASGVGYMPDQEMGLAIKASVNLGLSGSENAFNAEAFFEIAFYKSGGVKYISFQGNGYFMSTPSLGGLDAIMDKATAMAAKLDEIASQVNDMSGGVLEATGVIGSESLSDQLFGKPQNSKKASISASLNILIDFENSSLHGELRTYVNVAGGLISGKGTGGLAGLAVLHFDPQDWYIYIGKPQPAERIGVTVLNLATLDAYFVMGSIVPDSPPPPAEVGEILGGVDLNYMDDLNALADGAGIGFGASFRMDTGDLTFLMFYAKFQAGLGFDIMLKDYGANARCAGSTSALGIDGWYANGQAYAYFRGAIGIKVNLPFKKGDFKILDIGAAAILQAKLPNPTWMRGKVGGYYDILGGLVKGNCSFEVVIGEECQIVGGSALSGIEVIADLTPASGSNEVDVFTAPQAVFNMEVEKEFSIVDLDDIEKTFRIKIDHFIVKSKGSGNLVGSLEFNESNDVVVFDAVDILPGEEELKAEVQVSFEEFKNGRWVSVFIDGKKITERKVVTFNSGPAPKYIPDNNIEYSYPGLNQYNIYVDQHPQGYIKLKDGQPYLFKNREGWKQVVRFTGHNGEVTETTLNYEDLSVIFNYPELSTNTIYKWEIVNIPTVANQSIDENVSEQENDLLASSGTNDSEIIVTTNEAEGSIEQLQEEFVFSTHFRTSNFRTFGSKVDALDQISSWTWPLLIGVHELGANYTTSEGFDAYEINGTENSDPLIELVAKENYAWYKNDIKPLIYEKIDTYEVPLREGRRGSYEGVPPLRAISLNQSNTELLVTQDDFALGGTTDDNNFTYIIFNLPWFSYYDYIDVKNEAARRIANGNSNSWFNSIYDARYPSLRRGDYKVKMRYRLPGKEEFTEEREKILTN